MPVHAARLLPGSERIASSVPELMASFDPARPLTFKVCVWGGGMCAFVCVLSCACFHVLAFVCVHLCACIRVRSTHVRAFIPVHAVLMIIQHCFSTSDVFECV